LTTYPPIKPENIRIIVHVAELDGEVVADVPIAHLPKWVDGLETLTSSPMVKESPSGALVAAEIFRVALEAGEHVVVCLAATWVTLYA